jgi:hypothetical protein
VRTIAAGYTPLVHPSALAAASKPSIRES